MGICGSSPKTRGGDESGKSGGRMGKRQESVTNKSLVLLGEAASHSKSIRSVAIVLEGKLRAAVHALPHRALPHTCDTRRGTRVRRQSPAAFNLLFSRPRLASHPAPHLVYPLSSFGTDTHSSPPLPLIPFNPPSNHIPAPSQEPFLRSTFQEFLCGVYAEDVVRLWKDLGEIPHKQTCALGDIPSETAAATCAVPRPVTPLPGTHIASTSSAFYFCRTNSSLSHFRGTAMPQMTDPTWGNRRPPSVPTLAFLYFLSNNTALTAICAAPLPPPPTPTPVGLFPHSTPHPQKPSSR